MLGFRNLGGIMQKGQVDHALGSLIERGQLVIVEIAGYPNGWWWAHVETLEHGEQHDAVSVKLQSAIRTALNLEEQISWHGRSPAETFTVYPVTPGTLRLIGRLLDKKIQAPK